MPSTPRKRTNTLSLLSCGLSSKLTALGLEPGYFFIVRPALVRFHQFNQFHFRCGSKHLISARLELLTDLEGALGLSGVVQSLSVCPIWG